MIGKTYFLSKTTVRTLVLTSVFILSAVISPLLIKPTPVEAQVGTSSTCKAMIADYASWAQKSSNNVVDSQISGLWIKTHDPNARVDFGFGGWGHARLYAMGNSLSGYYQEFFSDRMNGKDQRFNWKKDDWMSVNISPNSGVTLKLDSWGGNIINVQNMSCTSDGFILGRLPGNWDNIITISLVKTYQ